MSGTGIRTDREILELSNTGQGSILSAAEKERVNFLIINSQTNELFAVILNLYTAGEQQKETIQSIWDELLSKMQSSQAKKANETKKRMFTALNDMQNIVKSILIPILGPDYESILNTLVESQRLKSQFKKIQKDTDDREGQLQHIRTRLQDLKLLAKDVNIENIEDLYKQLSISFASDSKHRQAIINAMNYQDTNFIALQQAISSEIVWTKILNALKIEKGFAALVETKLPFGTHSNNLTLMSQTFEKLPIFKDDLFKKIDRASENEKKQIVLRTQFLDLFFRNVDSIVQTNKIFKISKVNNTKKESPSISTDQTTKNYTITNEKWANISSEIIRKLSNHESYSVIASGKINNLTIKHQQSASNVQINKSDRSIQAVLPVEWFDAKLDSKQKNLIKVFLEQVHTLPAGTVVRIGNCKSQPEVAIILDLLVRKSGLKAKYDEKDGTKAAVDSLPPARTLRAAQAKSKYIRKKVPIALRRKKRIKP